ncbi:MAG: hypothetical protein WHS83_11130 [Chloroflexus sp.]|uniref:hypothetical protein n=1 Tax=Chloroflexus sp. TaxID=1904827 RepID=UPI00309D2CB5
MQRRMISFGMMICGVIAMIIGFTLLPLPTPSTAAPALQPSPRPTIPPVKIVPTSEPTVVPMGRVTGTIIDLRTYAPAPNIAVQVGDAVVYSDNNGNYDRWVESGFYVLALQLTPEQGSPGQPPLEIAVGPGDTVVAHLFFTSPAPNNATESGLTVEAPTAEPVPPPAAVPAIPESVPPKLPFTGIDTGSETAPAGNSNQLPSHLPRTATNTPFNASFWFVVGFILLAGGLGLQFWPVRRSSASREDQLLAELLTTPPASREELLRQLLSNPTER